MSLLTGTHEPPAAVDDERATTDAPVDVPVFAEGPEEKDARPPGRWRTVLRWTLTALALALVYAALLFPNRIYLLTPKAFLRIPVEGIVGAAILLVLPGRLRRIMATLFGLILGVLTILKVLDMGFFESLARPFNVMFDWSVLGNGMDFVEGSYGRAASIGAAIGAVVLLVAVLVLMTLAVRRLTTVLVGAEPHATRGIAALTVIWFVCAGFGYDVQGLPRTSNITAPFAYNTLRKVPAALMDRERFAKELKVDAFRDTPSDQLLSGLQGKDVIFTFIESYGRSAIEDPKYATQVDALLDAGSRRLDSAGFSARSAFLTSPTSGGGSWLAHSTLHSGLWINNEARYRSLVKSDRMTLTGAFQRADWRSVGVMPGLTGYWPEGDFFGFDKIYDARNLGFAGPKYQWSSIPDQYLLSELQRRELSKAGDAPVVAEVETTSSHAPWNYVPKLAEWDDVGDGKATAGPRPSYAQKSATEVRSQYRKTIEYSLSSVISYIEKYGNENTVMVFLGDHQPVPLIVGQNASRDVPVTIVARDPKVLDRITSWGWQDGLNPAPDAPVWRMDSFRDRFLTAFGD